MAPVPEPAVAVLPLFHIPVPHAVAILTRIVPLGDEVSVVVVSHGSAGSRLPPELLPAHADESNACWVEKVEISLVAAFTALDKAAVFFALLVVLRNVGMAIAAKMPIMRTTTMSSMRVKPSSPPWRFFSDRCLSTCFLSDV
jgi:hypothetical protein